VDLLILNEEPNGYRQPLRDQLRALISASARESVLDRPGGIFVRSSDQLASEDYTLILAAARLKNRLPTASESRKAYRD